MATGRCSICDVDEEALGSILLSLLASQDERRNMVLGDADAASLDGRFDLVKVARLLKAARLEGSKS